ncbi:hypothetical protein F5X98DRAFT_383426 [Xylaria grammica]|nr:hypothetical protein F5X98DRAFT_383426 [Xylaria grammica]
MSNFFRSTRSYVDSNQSQEGPQGHFPEPSVALNFFSGIQSANLTFYSSSELGLLSPKTQVVGKGAYASIQIGRGEVSGKHRTLAVKRSRTLSKDIPSNEIEDFEKHFSQITTELLILGSQPMRSHPHIVTLYGVCMDEFQGSPSLGLALEYAELGSLKRFLSYDDHGLSSGGLSDLIYQVVDGLGALHKAKICHGDIKTQNVLIFIDKASPCGFRAKISDFGESLIAKNGDSSTMVRCGIGTRLLNAPEIRNCDNPENLFMPLDQALLTDIYSLGLLAWEVLKRGQSYFDESWVSKDSDLDTMEAFLNALPDNQLLIYALNFLSSVGIDDEPRSDIETLFKGTLQDLAANRIPLSALGRISLQDFGILSIHGSSDRSSENASSTSGNYEDNVMNLLGMGFGGDSISSWTTRHSLYDLMDLALYLNFHQFEELPLEVRKRILSALKDVAQSDLFSEKDRAHAAMTVSECYTVAFSDTFDEEEVIFWMHRASKLGLQRASLWYPRICKAFRKTPERDENTTMYCEIDEGINGSLTDYLRLRIHSFNRVLLKNIKCQADDILHQHNVGTGLQFKLFNEDTIDEMHILHLACLLGQNDLVLPLTREHGSDVRSSLGLGPIHYACLGGQLSTLKLLLESGCKALSGGHRGITPLHLAVFFEPDEIQEAVTVLVQKGCSMSASTTSLNWEAHDVHIHGTPLTWAITVRYRKLVEVLAPYHSFPDYTCLHNAMRCYFWELIEVILPYFDGAIDKTNILMRLSPITRPFSHWIAHGEDGDDAVRRTIQLCGAHGWIGFNQDGTTHLEGFLSNVNTVKDLTAAAEMISVSSVPYVTGKLPGSARSSSLHAALQNSRNNNAWSEVIQKISDMHTLEDLEDSSREFGNYLGFAITTGSVVGTEILLRRGLKIDQPSWDRVPSAAIHELIENRGSIEMLSLLVKNGADLLAKHPILGASPLQSIILGQGQNISQKRLLEALLEYDCEDQVYIESLFLTLCLLWNHNEPKNHPSPEVFLFVLENEKFAKHINHIYEDGSTLIQQASNYLHLYSVRQLLDAGADASIPFQRGPNKVTPLQLACSQARGLYFMMRNGELVDDKLSINRMSQAMEVVRVLLEWHHARGDELFQGITDIHLACRIRNREELRNLRKQRQLNDFTTRGRWPGSTNDPTPLELWNSTIREDDDIAFGFPIFDMRTAVQHASEPVTSVTTIPRGEDTDSEDISSLSES